jgi:hypothetical protein
MRSRLSSQTGGVRTRAIFITLVAAALVVTAFGAIGYTSPTVTAAGQQYPPEGQINLPGGGISIPATSVSLPERLIITQVQFSPNPVRSRSTIITARVTVRDTRGYFVRGALVFLRSTPLVTTTPAERATPTNGTITLQFQPRSTFPLKDSYFVQFFVRARKTGDDLLAGVSTRRLVQLRTASP